ncbi:DUF6339 family protein [Virgibacillus sp. MG-45]|uniref:DUF6339 family protein n=1 Tax=Virgibacillus sp. MG-45 TaxID=3102791 RepID=UPI002EDA5ADB
MWKSLSKSEAGKEMLKWDIDKVPNPDCDGDMKELREKILSASQKATEFIHTNEKQSSKKDYYYDLRFGLELYLLLKNDYHFNERKASDDTIWIYLSIKVVPDLVYARWGLNINRYYKQTRRIWLRTIWWYVHLSWNDNKEDTYKMLRDFTTDEIVQLVERSGPKGYRINVTREIMKQFSELNSIGDRNLFRKIMKLNTARLKIVEPSLTQGGNIKYVKELIDYFGYANTNKVTEKPTKYTTSG